MSKLDEQEAWRRYRDSSLFQADLELGAAFPDVAMRNAFRAGYQLRGLDAAPDSASIRAAAMNENPLFADLTFKKE